MSTHDDDEDEQIMHSADRDDDDTEKPVWFQPHAFHLNLPPNFLFHDEDDYEAQKKGEIDSESHIKSANDPKLVPGITQFAGRKARQIIELAHSIEIQESMFEFSITSHGGTDSVFEEDVEEIKEDPSTKNVAFDADGYCGEIDMVEVDKCDEDGADGAENLTTTQSTISQKLIGVHRKCSRLQTQMAGLENLKCGGISQVEICQMFLHLLRLVTATVTYNHQNLVTQPEEDLSLKEIVRKRNPKIHFENVGRLVHFDSKESNHVGDDYALSESEEQLEEELLQEFALPSPSREVLLLVLINMLSKKGPLRSVSNASIYPHSETNRMLMILQWKPLLRMLLRTAPYLDEKKTGKCPVKNSNSRHNIVLKRTVQLCRDARHFFEQGVRPHGPNVTNSSLVDKTSHEVWNMVSTDILYHSHTHACYRGTILLYLFQPSRCTTAFYLAVLSSWWAAWTNIDRCPEFDFLWLTLFCRARKYVPPESYDWGPIRKRLLTHCQYWLQLPIGGTSLDKSFPRAGSPRSRSCPARLKVFAGANSSYEEGIDFVAKVAKLLVSSLGAGNLVKQGEVTITEGTYDILRFLAFVTPYFNPSNIGSWTFALGALLHYFAYELCCRLGVTEAHATLELSHPNLLCAAREAKPGLFREKIPPQEVVALLHALLPLCKQALYSKNLHVGRAGEAAMLYLVHIDPEHTAPAFIDFAISALDVSAVNLSHQAPAALSALTRLIQPSLRNNPSFFLTRLPEILRLSLAGIDSNDQNKTIRTLVLYRSLASWIPVGGQPEKWESLSLDAFTDSGSTNDGTIRLGVSLHDKLKKSLYDPRYLHALKQIPDTSLLHKGLTYEDATAKDESLRLLLDEAASAMSDWSLEFLERVFILLRTCGEREKAGKTASAVANRHSSADVHHARNFSRVLKECLIQVFAAMDDQTHASAVNSVSRFLQEETLPAASKDASLLCQAVAAARTPFSSRSNIKECAQAASVQSPGLIALIDVLTSNLERHSTKTLIYRIRCLAGAVRNASHDVFKYKDVITSAIQVALSSNDRHLFKTGCKLLRHTLATLTEAYPIPSDTRPRTYKRKSSTEGQPQFDIILGRSAQLHDDPVKWHVPDGKSIDFAWTLIKSHVVRRIDLLCHESEPGDKNWKSRSKLFTSTDVNEIRRCLRVIRYCIRGAASVLLDDDRLASSAFSTSRQSDFVPYELAMWNIMNTASSEAKDGLFSIRGRLCSFCVILSSIIASETLHPDALSTLSENHPYRKVIPMICSDPKICKETSDIALLLLTRRGAAFRSQEAGTIWKAQKQLASDFILSSCVDQLSELLQSAAVFVDPMTLLYKDGEDGGKTMARRLLVSRVQLFHDSLQRHASFEIPRRLRRNDNRNVTERTQIFKPEGSLLEMLENLEGVLRLSITHPLDTYEGIADGLYALCCHSNSEVRASAISVVDYALTRFGWMVPPRVPRLLAGLALSDQNMNGKFGVPSCSNLVQNVNHQGKRKRLAETVKGICSILSLPRSIKVILQSEKLRFTFTRTICGTDTLISLLPTEEMQKLVHYFQSIFSPMRSKYYYLPRISEIDLKCYSATLRYSLAVLSENKEEADVLNESSEGGAAHWRKRLLAGWFLMTSIDEEEMRGSNNSISRSIWSTCFRIIETETGQPLQRVALGLLGRLVSIVLLHGTCKSLLEEKMASASFCKQFAEAIVFDHKEDSSVGGGHNAQWATGVEDIVRDAARNVAPRTLFPFQRTSQALISFKASHAQLVEAVLFVLEKDVANVAAGHLLKCAVEMAVAPPNEDQRNQQITSAEIIAGVLGSFLRREYGTYSFSWEDTLLPLIEDVVIKVPFSLTAAYFDTLRYALQFCPANQFLPLTRWIVEKIKSSLWKTMHEDQTSSGNETLSLGANTTQGLDGFTSQSKWLYLFTAIILEIEDCETGNKARPNWYIQALVQDPKSSTELSGEASDHVESWVLIYEHLLPTLLAALGHPFDSCRDHISRCLFRICYCHRKTIRVTASREPRILSSTSSQDPETNGLSKDPGLVVVDKLARLLEAHGSSFTDRYNALSTARRFISYSVHLGEAKFEYADYVIPLLPLTFEVLKSTVEDEIEADTDTNSEENAAKRALEAEVIKGFRFTIAEISTTAIISYGGQSEVDKVLDVVVSACKHDTWQVRHAGIHFLRCFEGAHKFLLTKGQNIRTMQIVAGRLGDDRREVSSAAMAALTGILASLPPSEVSELVLHYSSIAESSKMNRNRKDTRDRGGEHQDEKEAARTLNQKTSVFFLCAVIMAQPYETPSYVPFALAAISKHSFERHAPLGVRDSVKRCCAEYKRTHMSDNWDVHRSVFTQEQLEALEDVVSSPHYYA